MTVALMLDCESLDTAPTAALLSVGIVAMDMDSLTLGKKFYLRIDADDCIRHGMTVSADTIRWWTEQSPEFLKAAFNRTLENGTGFNGDNDYWNPLEFALPKISNFISQFGARTELWACGSRDFEWLETAYKALRTPVPWQYHQWRDYRTMREMIPTRAPSINDRPHHALADACYQAEHLMAIIRAIDSRGSKDEL